MSTGTNPLLDFEAESASSSSDCSSDGSARSNEVDANLVTVQAEYDLNKQELKTCSLFATQLVVNSESAGWGKEETARLIYLVARTLDFGTSKVISFINEVKVGSPELIAALGDYGFEFSAEKILSMIKVCCSLTFYFDSLDPAVL